ncbi:MAG: peptidylprolyl isomerase [Gemmatimonadota bacterium]|nr:peptidylprolyl isomerase [Gemmatimonadota bacterium]
MPSDLVTVPVRGMSRYRRWPAWVLATSLALAGCAEESPLGPVARVGDRALTSGRLADLLVLGQPLSLDSGTVASLVDHWVSMAALAQRAAAGDDLLGPEAMEASLWLERREAVLEEERRERLGDVATVTPAAAAEAFESDTLVLLAHVLRRTEAGTSPAERNLQRRTAEAILGGLTSGGSWAAAVAQSEDQETRDETGLLGLMRPDEVPGPLRAAATQLLPGQVSSVVESPAGFHIVYRPRFQDVAGLFARLLSERIMAESDTRAGRELLDRISPRVSPEGPAVVRRLAVLPVEGEPPGVAGQGGDDPVVGSPVATWDGGGLDRDIVARYVWSLPDPDRAALVGAPDPAVTAFVLELVKREIRFRDGARRGVALEGEREEALREVHREDVSFWLGELAAAGGEPAQGASLDRYMERLVARRVALRPVPPLLRRWLLEPLGWRVDTEAMLASTALSRRLIAAAEEIETTTGGRP